MYKIIGLSAFALIGTAVYFAPVFNDEKIQTATSVAKPAPKATPKKAPVDYDALYEADADAGYESDSDYESDYDTEEKTKSGEFSDASADSKSAPYIPSSSQAAPAASPPPPLVRTVPGGTVRRSGKPVPTGIDLDKLQDRL